MINTYYEVWVKYRYREEPELYCKCNKADMLNAIDDLTNVHNANSQGVVSIEVKKHIFG